MNEPPKISKAEQLAGGIDPVPQGILHCVRAIHSARVKLQGQNVQQYSAFVAEEVLKVASLSPPIVSAFYFAALQFYPDRLGQGIEALEGLIGCFNADEQLAILLLSFMTRRHFKGALSPQRAQLLQALYTELEFASCIGRSIATANNGEAMLTVAMRTFALVCLELANPEKFSAYLPQYMEGTAAQAIAEEQREWQCNHLDVAAFAFLKLGMGSQYSRSLLTAYAEKAPVDADERHINLYYRLSRDIRQLGQVPEWFDIDSWFQDRKVWVAFKSRIEETVKNKPRHDWLLKEKADIPTKVAARFGM